MDKKSITQYERRLKKETEDKKVLDAIDVLKNCDDYELRKQYHKRLVKLLCSREYSIENLPENPIDLSIKILIRADLDSYIPKIDNQNLSPSYLEASEKKQSNSKVFSDTDYLLSLQNSKGWKIVNQFTSFQKIFKYARKKLLEKQINPEAVKEMSVMDCMHFVSKNCKSVFKEYSLKKKFVQTFIRHNEEDLRKVHLLQGVDVRYTNALVKAMINDGISCGIKVLDEKGNEIKGPEYHVHHRIPVKHAGETNYLSEVNLFKNLVLVEKDIYHKLIHICEKSEYVADKRYFSKLLTPKNSVLISGLEPNDLIYYDFENAKKIINPALECVSLPEQKNETAKSTNTNNENKANKTGFRGHKMPFKKRGGRNG